MRKRLLIVSLAGLAGCQGGEATNKPHPVGRATTSWVPIYSSPLQPPVSYQPVPTTPDPAPIPPPAPAPR